MERIYDKTSAVIFWYVRMGSISKALASGEPIETYILVREAAEEIGLDAGTAGRILLELVRTQHGWSPPDEN